MKLCQWSGMNQAATAIKKNPNHQHPWGKRKKSDGPPDLDQVFQDLKHKIRGLFGKKPSPTSNNHNANPGRMSIAALLVLALVITGILYLLFGFYTIASYEQGVLTRFGKYHRTVSSGLHWLPLFMDDVKKS